MLRGSCWVFTNICRMYILPDDSFYLRKSLLDDRHNLMTDFPDDRLSWWPTFLMTDFPDDSLLLMTVFCWWQSFADDGLLLMTVLTWWQSFADDSLYLMTVFSWWQSLPDDSLSVQLLATSFSTGVLLQPPSHCTAVFVQYVGWNGQCLVCTVQGIVCSVQLAT